MIFAAESLSDFEYCLRLPQIQRIFSPPQWPVRDAIKDAFQAGIRGIMGGDLPENQRIVFIDQAASPGFIYPKGEHFIMANDFADWLEGALGLVKESAYPMEPLDLFKIEDNFLQVDAWCMSDSIHIFRAQANLGERYLKWPELAVMALTDNREVFIHVYRLPTIRDGRLVSPLNIAYQHPSPKFANTNYRLAKLEGEEFSAKWKKVGRWEIQPKVTWDEWRKGIDKDRCMNQIREIYSLGPISDVREKERIRFDLANMLKLMEMPHVWPLFREACQDCIFAGLCHGDEDSRAQYKADPEELEKYKKKVLDIRNII